jgi:hypothetical protein
MITHSHPVFPTLVMTTATSVTRRILLPQEMTVKRRHIPLTTWLEMLKAFLTHITLIGLLLSVIRWVAR